MGLPDVGKRFIHRLGKGPLPDPGPAKVLLSKGFLPLPTALVGINSSGWGGGQG